ncbi:polysaccharide biosynthesis/export family protein [uncultured Bacteroides sp.]|uniref:polysaccharide biosynthesis/export family protein n=1 Tax=uncultured Bacteroides sp. TaxID=162156 RepID=UPI002AA8AA7C|nr:polysaccharide biosynthesis/export family protein [uncultured Bacteroides sp.]
MKQIFYILIVITLFSSCTSQKQISYLQDIQGDYSMKIGQKQDATVQTGDWMSIIISSKDAELAQMFNLPIVSNSIVGNEIYSGGTNRVSGYLVDENGYIDFPQLGSIKIQGMTLIEISSLIKRKLIDRGYLNDPTVTTQYMNFKISVMGEVAHPGTFSISTGRITLLEALSMAGDLTIFGKRENVKVIREENGIRNVVNMDLRSKKIFNSPYFYLHQNDMVYVEPNKVRAGQREINQNRSIGTFASIISVLISLSVLIFK